MCPFVDRDSFIAWSEIVVYPFSAILFTFNSDFVSPGSMMVSLASDDNCSKGSCVLLVACSVESSGRYTVI